MSCFCRFNFFVVVLYCGIEGFKLVNSKQGRMIEFAKCVADYVAASGKKNVVVLSSLDFGRWQRVDTSRYKEDGSCLCWLF